MILNQSIILDDFIYCIKEFFLVQSEASYSDIDNKVHEFIKLIKNKNINIQNLLNKELLAFIKNTEFLKMVNFPFIEIKMYLLLAILDLKGLG